MQTSPKFSIIIPIKELNDYVNETVAAVQEMDFVDWELFIVTNEDEDSRWKDDARIQMLRSGRVGPAEKRDLASTVATGSYLVFLDDDSFPRLDFLAVAAQVLEDEGVVAIGGPAITPESDSYWQKVSGAAFLSKIVGGAPERYRSMGGRRLVDDWPSVNFIIEREVFKTLGGFNSPFWPGEDTFLCWKLKKSGFSVLYVPNLVVWHHRREGLRRHLKQVGAYGLHRGYFMRKFPETSRRLKYLMPVGLLGMNLLGITSLVFGLGFAGIYLALLSAYIFLLILGVLEVTRYVGARVAFASGIYVAATHSVYAVSIVRGLLHRGELESRLR